ncbi:MAG: hypothetical protein OEV49_01750 [candidate division Zixibacteria bacterium]|nr:hypothetical protein [candidate division Zixibacteria bacterium]MDH3938869.1 hypothetical protein [candidate division Zixibacteria bacterium]MDH4032247.1 hypothetical protein [candidate division Zixibacteria bacterium]
MRNFYVSLTLTLFGILFSTSGVMAGVYVELVDTTDWEIFDTLPTNEPLTWYVKADNDVGSTVTSMSNSIRIYSLQGATWQVPTYAVGPDFTTYFDVNGINVLSLDGISDDMIGISALALFTSGMPDGQTGLELFRFSSEISDTDFGDTICVDTAILTPTGAWMWATSSGSAPPGWGGPYCWTIGGPSTCYADGDANDDGIGLSTGDLVYLHAFIFSGGPEPPQLYSCNLNGDDVVDVADFELYEDYFVFGLSVFDPYGGYPVPSPCDPTPVPSCCTGIRGNVDGDQEENTDISDLVYTVDWMFLAGDPPPCPQEADLNGDDVVDIADLVYIVDFMFNDGPAPGACPGR